MVGLRKALRRQHPEPEDRKCEICKTVPEDILHVDHCHVAKTFRGYLCRSCNMMLGCAKDNIQTLLAGVDFIKEHKDIMDILGAAQA
jgi:hypothetical protein